MVSRRRFAGEKSEWGEGWRRRVQCAALGHRPIHRDRLRPVRAANPQALLSLAEDSLALNRSRAEHSTAPRPGPDCCTLLQCSLSALPAARRRAPVHARHPRAAPSSARRVWRRHSVPRYALHRPAWPCRSTRRTGVSARRCAVVPCRAARPCLRKARPGGAAWFGKARPEPSLLWAKTDWPRCIARSGVVDGLHQHDGYCAHSHGGVRAICMCFTFSVQHAYTVLTLRYE